MAKQRRTVSLEPEVDEYLSQSGVNASELVNELVEKHMNGGASEDQIREFRKKQVKSEYEQYANQARMKLEELNELQEREEQENQQEKEGVDQRWSDALDVMDVDEIGGTKVITTDEKFVSQWADKLNMDIAEFKAEVIQRTENKE